MEKDVCIGELYTELFYAVIPTLFPFFCCSAILIPYYIFNFFFNSMVYILHIRTNYRIWAKHPTRVLLTVWFCSAAASTYGICKSQSKVPTESTQVGNKMNIGIELKFLSSKAVTVISLPWNLHSVITPENRNQQAIVLLEDYWYVKCCVCICKLHKLNCTAIMYFDFYISVLVHVIKYDYVITLL